jgi:hypothetical protein
LGFSLEKHFTFRLQLVVCDDFSFIYLFILSLVGWFLLMMRLVGWYEERLNGDVEEVFCGVDGGERDKKYGKEIEKIRETINEMKKK